MSMRVAHGYHLILTVTGMGCSTGKGIRVVSPWEAQQWLDA